MLIYILSTAYFCAVNNIIEQSTQITIIAIISSICDNELE